MNIDVKKNVNSSLKDNKIKISIEIAKESENINKLIEYIKNFEKKQVVVSKGNEIQTIELSEILYFYSDKKYNYCKTVNEEFKIKSKLYELEKNDVNFLRISKSCVINVQNVKCFDLGETSKIIVRFCDDSEQIVARRKIKDVMNYLDERGI